MFIDFGPMIHAYLGQKKVILCPEIGWVKTFLSFTRLHCRMCNRIYIFNLKTNKQTKKQQQDKNQKKLKKKGEYLWIFPSENI